MRRRLVASYLALTIVVLLALEVPLGFQFARSERRDLTARVERDAFAAASLAEDTLQTGSGKERAGLQTVAVRYLAETGGRIVIVDRRGTSIADSRPLSARERDFSTRAEIRAALHGRVATGVRHSSTLHTDLLYAAVPVASAGVVYGAVRITYPTSTLDARIHRYWLMLAAIFAVVLVAATLVAVRFARWIAAPLGTLESAAAAAGEGDLAVRAPETGPPEVRALASSFNRMAAKLAALFDSQQSFVADASHQLRTPLTALRLRLENLDAAPGTQQPADIVAALREVGRLSLLVDGLLALARAESGRAPSGVVDLGATIRERVDAWEPLAAERGVRLSVAAGEVTAWASADRVAQVLDNLLANALDAAPSGSAVDVSADLSPPWATVRVADRGPGMTDAELAHAFERFWRGRSGGDGTGLGLAIVRGLVTSDGGQVELARRDGGGLEARVRYGAAYR